MINVFSGLLHAPEIVDNHTLAETALIEALKKYEAFITPGGLRHCCDRRDGKGRKIAFIMPYREGLKFLLAKFEITNTVINTGTTGFEIYEKKYLKQLDQIEDLPLAHL